MSDPDTSPSGSELVLLVEDEPVVRKLARKALLSNGYRVLEASDGLQALHLMERLKERVDLILSDLGISS